MMPKYNVRMVVDYPSDPTPLLEKSLPESFRIGLNVEMQMPGNTAQKGDLWMLQFSDGTSRPYIFDSDREWSGVSEEGDYNAKPHDDSGIVGGYLMWSKEAN
jgi:hypothetical protein